MATSAITTTEGLLSLEDVYYGLLRWESTELLPDGLPRFLFRAERDVYPDTLTWMDRLYHKGKIDGAVYHELDSLTSFVISQPFARKMLKGRQALAFARHYGMPTQIYDFTASAKIAMGFAANRNPNEHNAKGGSIAILNVERALSAGCIIEDLRHHPFAKRAALQHSISVMYSRFRMDDFYDLKDPEIIDEIGLVWVPFTHLPDEGDFLRAIGLRSDILSVADDPFAGLAQEFVDRYVNEFGPFSDKAARLLAEAIPNIGRSRDENLFKWSIGYYGLA